MEVIPAAISRSYVWPSDYNWHSPPPPHLGGSPPFAGGSSTFITHPRITHHTPKHHGKSQLRQKKFPPRHQQPPMPQGVVFPWLVSMWVVENLHYSSSNEHVNSRKFKDIFRWKEVDYLFPSAQTRQSAIASKSFIPKNNLPLGIEITKDKVFISIPRWKKGVPCTLAVVDKNDKNPSPPMRPFPSWKWHEYGNCNGMTSVFRMSLDPCGHLWVLDSGSVDLLESVHQICPPQILVFDVQTEKLIWRYEIPKDQSPEDSLFTNIIVDVRGQDCGNAFAYVSDVFRYGLLVYDWQNNKSWRISHPHFYPDPLVSRYDIDGIIFRWTDGIFGLALSPTDPKTGDRLLYFHPLSSFREFAVSTEILRNETKSKEEMDSFNAIGQPRGRANSHASASAMDDDGILYYNLVSKSAVGCWNSKNGPHGENTQAIIESDNETLSFPNDLKIDHSQDKSIWVLSNRLHKYLYSKLSKEEYNFRILKANARDAVQGTICQPGARTAPSKPACYYEL